MKRFYNVLLLFILTSTLVFGEYPYISQFSIFQDENFKRLQQELELISPLIARWDAGQSDPEIKELLISQIQFYRYRVAEGDTLFTIAADLMLNSDSIASLNGIENPLFIEPGKSLVIPNQPGIFLCNNSRNQLDKEIYQTGRSITRGFPLKVRIDEVIQDFLFFPGQRFTREERLFFIRRPFQSPLDRFSMGSPFGFRTDPFSGNNALHQGIDLNVPKGTPLRAIKSGTIIETGVLDNYGLYIIINHQGGYSSLYGHLDQINVSVNDRITENSIIGRTGNTGRSTGPHLHLEIRLDGIPVDPASLIRQQ